MIEVILIAAETIYTTYQIERTLKDTSKKQQPISADDFFPIFVYVIVQSRIQSPYYIKQYIWDYSPTNQLQGAAGYYLTVYEAALEYLLKLDENKKVLSGIRVLEDAFNKRGIRIEICHAKLNPQLFIINQKNIKTKLMKKIFQKDDQKVIGIYGIISIEDNDGILQHKKQYTQLELHNLTTPSWYQTFQFQQIQIRKMIIVLFVLKYML